MAKKSKWKKFCKEVKAKTSTICLIVMFVLVFIFTGVCLKLFRETGAEPSTLIVSFFALMTGECGMLALIKTTKTKYKEDEQDDSTG